MIFNRLSASSSIGRKRSRRSRRRTNDATVHRRVQILVSERVQQTHLQARVIAKCVAAITLLRQAP